MTIQADEILSKDEAEERDEAATELRRIADDAKSITVDDDESYQHALDRLERVKKVHSVVESIADRFREAAYEAYQRQLEIKKDLLSPGEEAIDHLKSEAESYYERQLESERERQKRLKEKAQENPEKAKEVISELKESEAPVPDAEGVHYRTRWKARLDTESYDRDQAKRLVAHAVAEGRAPASLIEVSKSELNKLAKQRKHEHGIEGITVERDDTLVDRR